MRYAPGMCSYRLASKRICARLLYGSMVVDSRFTPSVAQISTGLSMARYCVVGGPNGHDSLQRCTPGVYQALEGMCARRGLRDRVGLELLQKAVTLRPFSRQCTLHRRVVKPHLGKLLGG
jgi:hypothetical protein